MKKSKNRVVISGVETRIENNTGSVVVGSTDVRVNRRASGSSMDVNATGTHSIAIGGTLTGTVINDGEVWVNGEKCYPRSQIKALAMAYDLLVMAACAVMGQPEDVDAEYHYQRCAERVQRNLEALDLK
jgi:hypothetical protein